MRESDIEHPQLSLAVKILRDNLLFMAAAASSVPKRLKAGWHGWRSGTGVAIHELEVGSAPVEVAIDEAVTLAKRYASEDAGRLVNGILGRVAREHAA